jgi:hypothetical protein
MSKENFIKNGYKWVKVVKNGLKKKRVVKGLALDLANTEASLVLKPCPKTKCYIKNKQYDKTQHTYVKT